MLNLHWQPATAQLHLGAQDVHLFLADLDAQEQLLRYSTQILAPDEIERGNRFYVEQDRRRYQAGRLLLRLLLAAYLDIPPSLIQFSYNHYGKPSAAQPLHTTNIQFNLSNSANIALFAFCKTVDVGIDIEKIRPEFTTHEIAEKYFSRDEVTFVRTIALDSVSAFYDCWTRKEAYIKAKGQGLSIPLDSFAVSLDPEQAPGLLYSRLFADDVKQYALYALPMEASFKAALAIARKENDVRLFSLSAELMQALQEQIVSVGDEGTAIRVEFEPPQV